MQGLGYGQPVKQPPHTGWLVFLRVLFVVLGFFSIGFLSWAMLLRLALVTRRSLDWGLFVAVLAADVLSLTLLATEPGDEVNTTGGYVGMLLLLGGLVCATAYYLAADIRHFMMRQQAYAAQRSAPAYGYPGPANPYSGTQAATAPAVPHHSTAQPAPTGPHTPPPVPHTPVPHTPVPHTPVPHTPVPHTPVPHTPVPHTHTPVPRPPSPTPPSRRPAPARIDQVRAELDELSDYLRQHGVRRDGEPGGGHDGRQDAGHEGGR
ncbi:hypothetical protein ACGFT2_09790 [Streptomyces sp. NPDC048514]|uniref:hypothetical protein n=1 Tax=Streptomyces sp. NPDC048514 TaxID=3365564 RepID=UPI003712A899